MSVPETAVDKDYCFIFGKNYVRLPRELFVMKSVSEAHRKQPFSDLNFLSGILAFHARHHDASRGGVYNVGHG